MIDRVLLRAIFIGLAAVGGIGLALIWWFRRRFLAPDQLEGWRRTPPAALTPAERKRLERWQRRLRVQFGGSALYFVAVVAFADTLQGQGGSMPLALAYLVLLILVAAGLLSQFAARCPRCGLNIGLQSSMGLPPKCERCGVAFKETPPPEPKS
jgi:hypothetical protein